MQAAVLADLTATWVIAHRESDWEATRALRVKVLNLHLAAICKLIGDATKQEVGL